MGSARPISEMAAVAAGKESIDTPDGPKCLSCGAVLVVGSYPFCRGNPADHDTARSQWAQRFEPIIVDRDPETGQISYPGSSRDPVPDGYVRESLDTIQKIDRFCASRSREETEKRHMVLRAEMEHFDARQKERRDRIKDIIRQKGFSGKMFDAICARVDQKREAKYAKLLNQDVHFFSDVFAFNSSNRESHSDVTTGWKSRKG